MANRKSIDITTLSGWSSLSDGAHNITIVAKADGYRDSEPSAAVSIKVYSITVAVTNGTYGGDTTITDNATITITADSGYKLPSTVTVTGASYTWNKQTGTLALSNPTGAVAVLAECVGDVKEVWYFNNSLTLPSGDSQGFTHFNIKFISNNTSFVEIETWNKKIGSMHITTLSYIGDNTAGDVTAWAGDEGWNAGGSVYRTIHLLEPATGDLLTWLRANATKQ